MCHIRKISISIVCLITAAILTSTSPTAGAQPNGGDAGDNSTTPQTEDSAESISELQLRIKELVQKLQDKKRIRKEEKQFTPSPSLNDSSEESDTPQASQIFRTPKTNHSTDSPQITEAPKAPARQQTPEQTQTPMTQQDPTTQKTSEKSQDSGTSQAPEKTQPLYHPHPLAPIPLRKQQNLMPLENLKSTRNPLNAHLKGR